MGDIAEDMLDAALATAALDEMMHSKGAKRCDHPCHRLDIYEGECPKCYDLGWVDSDGNPCEI